MPGPHDRVGHRTGVTDVPENAERHDERAAGDRRQRTLSDGEAGSSDDSDDADTANVGGGGPGLACWTGKVVPGKRPGDEADRNTEEEDATPVEGGDHDAAIEGPATLITPQTVEFMANTRGACGRVGETDCRHRRGEQHPDRDALECRPITSSSIVGASPHNADVITKPTMDQRKTLRVPRLSTTGPAAATPDMSNSTVIVHGRSATSPRSFPMSGRAAVRPRLE